MTELTRTGDVFVLHLGEGDLRFNATTVGEINRALDEVEQAEGPRALVTTASGKVFSNGLDLEFIGTLGDGWIAFIASVEALFARLLRLPLFTVAAVQGHAFAGGAMLALCHDVRVMREDRGFLCLPEIDLGMAFTPGMEALLASKLPQPALHRLAVLGQRWSGPQALAGGVVDGVAAETDVLRIAVERAADLAPKAGLTVTAIRKNFYAATIAALDPSAS